jgi:hypothetical protein
VEVEEEVHMVVIIKEQTAVVEEEVLEDNFLLQMVREEREVKVAMEETP